MARTQPVLLQGTWQAAEATGAFRAVDPDTGEELDRAYPVSSRADVDRALSAGAQAARELARVPPETIAAFLDHYADLLDSRAREIAETAGRETALPVSPRLADVELPRTTDQLRQAAVACRGRDWTLPTIDSASNIRSMFGPLGGPVAVFGPNNFPLAFNAVSGGDFAAAIAAGNPVIAKGHTSHPHTGQLMAEAALEAVHEAGLPGATVQMIYRTSHDDGAYLVSHPLIGATGYTGSRLAALVLKAAADAAGKPIYLEMSSVNPVFILPGALRERGDEIAEQLQGSALLGTGQFCTSPGVIVVVDDENSSAFLNDMRRRFAEAPVGPLLGTGGVSGLSHAVQTLTAAGADLLTGGTPVPERGCRFENTLLRTTGRKFLASTEELQTEAFGNANLFVVADDEDEMVAVASAFQGNLTGCVYTHTGDVDDALYDRVAAPLRRRVGRLLNDKMPTGVAVTAAMNHGGPFPATGHPGFTAVGVPASLRRFAMLQCYDNVRQSRLPAELRDENPTGGLWRCIDGAWTRADVEGGDSG